MQRRRLTTAEPLPFSFNPHPPREADATQTRTISRWADESFNPHPPREADATQTRTISRWADESFNPHPPREADATFGNTRRATVLRVSILTRPVRRMQRGLGTQTTPETPVSILTRPESRMQRWSGRGNGRDRSNRPARFQSSPAPRVGCNPSKLRSRLMVSWFQSSPAPRGGCNHQRAARVR